jgi:2-amino-4-hydroxy-6-hydroxymethyldihydropteridine diphosphokinase
MVVQTLLLALGANRAGAWGSPEETLERARCELVGAGLRIRVSSRLYQTVPLGPGRQPCYLNAVLLADARLAPAALLRLMKRLERSAGRRVGARWGPRCLDIDILDFAGRRFGWVRRHRAHRSPRRLILPHPEIHRRAFVLVPLLEVAPHWQHPTLSTKGRTLLERLPDVSRRGVRRSLAF